MDWERLFASRILDRGYDYYYDGAVEDLKYSDKFISAHVQGTEDYEVEITLDDGEIVDMNCSCPYAADGHHCKHMAAVLYEWSEAKENEIEEATREYNITENKQKFDDILQLIDATDPKDVHAFLASILVNDEKLLLRFRNFAIKELRPEDMQKYKQQADRITQRYLGRDHFISYYVANDYISEMVEMIHEDIGSMMDNGEYLSAFEVVNYIFVLVGDVDMDDSDGGGGELAEEVYQVWLDLLEKVSPEDKRKMFDWFTSHLDGSVVDYFEEYIEQIIIEEFNEKEYDQDKLEFIESMINDSQNSRSEWSRKYQLDKWAVCYLDMLRKMNASDEQIEEVCRKYWQSSEVRKYYVELCMNRKDYDRALQVLDESLNLDNQYRGLVLDYYYRKKEIYRLQGNQEAYLKQLWQLMLENGTRDMDLYRELKSQYSKEEWIKQREELFKKLPKDAAIDQLYKEEELYDRLLAFVLRSSGLSALQRYEDVLIKDYPQQILEKYRDEVSQMARYTSNRKQYAYMVSLLRRMREIDGGAQMVKEIADEWRSNYGNRRAMMDELRKL